MAKTVVLTVLDGWGIGRSDTTNPIYAAQPPYLSYLTDNFPSGALQASGISSGLPWEESGNSSSGHLNLGAGRIIYQNYPRISLAIRNQGLASNQVLQNILTNLKLSSGTLHLVFLLSKKHNHSAIDHLKAVTDQASSAGVPVLFHFITDGLDSPAESSSELIFPYDPTRIASLSGRYYAMDTDERWTITEKAYSALIGNLSTQQDPLTYLKSAHDKNQTDTYISPASFNNHILQDADTLLFLNFNAAGLHQLATPFIEKDFTNFTTKHSSSLTIATLTSYDSSWTTLVLFPTLDIKNSLCEVISTQNKISIKIGETIKYASLTYYFNGYREAPFKNEYRVLLPSIDNPHPDQTPELRLKEITSRAIQSINERVFNLIIINIANPDIIGQTGNLTAAKTTVLAIDKALENITKTTLATNVPHLIVGSHGNLEEMVDIMTGLPKTGNTANPVPLYLVDSSHVRRSSNSLDNNSTIGLLSDVAPTILKLLDLPIPPDITGQSLLPYLI